MSDGPQSSLGCLRNSSIRLADNPQSDEVVVCQRKLMELADRLDQFYAFSKGQFVKWKPGLKNRKFPDYGANNRNRCPAQPNLRS